MRGPSSRRPPVAGTVAVASFVMVAGVRPRVGASRCGGISWPGGGSRLASALWPATENRADRVPVNLCILLNFARLFMPSRGIQHLTCSSIETVRWWGAADCAPSFTPAWRALGRVGRKSLRLSEPCFAEGSSGVVRLRDRACDQLVRGDFAGEELPHPVAAVVVVALDRRFLAYLAAPIVIRVADGSRYRQRDGACGASKLQPAPRNGVRGLDS